MPFDENSFFINVRIYDCRVIKTPHTYACKESRKTNFIDARQNMPYDDGKKLIFFIIVNYVSLDH